MWKHFKFAIIWYHSLNNRIIIPRLERDWRRSSSLSPCPLYQAASNHSGSTNLHIISASLLWWLEKNIPNGKLEFFLLQLQHVIACSAHWERREQILPGFVAGFCIFFSHPKQSIFFYKAEVSRLFIILTAFFWSAFGHISKCSRQTFKTVFQMEP